MIGIVHPGAMGSAVARLLPEVAWVSEGRSAATRARAEGFTDAGSLARLKDTCEVVLSVCPPHAAVRTAREFRDYPGIYADLNAVSPATAAEIGALVPRYADGGIVGPPPAEPGTTRLYLSGTEAPAVAALFEGTALEPRVLGDRPGDASALKMTYAAWTKGTNAMLLAVRAAAHELGVEDALIAEWEVSQPGLADRSEHAARVAAEKGWRWAYEMEEIGRTFAAAGLPDGFGAASAEVYGRFPREGSSGLCAALERLTTSE